MHLDLTRDEVILVRDGLILLCQQTPPEGRQPVQVMVDALKRRIELEFPEHE